MDSGDSTPDVGARALNGARSPCGEIRGNPSTGLSTSIAAFYLNPYLGRLIRPGPYMGVPISGDFRRGPDFSTPNAIYPQIIASYPQKNCLVVMLRRKIFP
jgi:hypothetical protein